MLRGMWRRILAIAVVMAFILAMLLAAEVFSLAPEGQPRGVAHAHNQYLPVYASLVQLLLRGWQWLRDVDHDTVATLAIVATAIFTGTLWRSTNRLWKSSQIHAGHMAASVGAADKAAAAAVRASEATIRLAEADRPWLVFKHFTEAEGRDIRINDVGYPTATSFKLHFINAGRAPAIDIRLWLEKAIFPRRGVIPSFARPERENSNIHTCGPGIEIESAFAFFVGEEEQNILSRRSEAAVYCYITYSSPTIKTSKEFTTETCLCFTYRGGSAVDSSGKPLGQFSGRTMGNQNAIT
jgi:hypothetical protein